MNDGVVDLLIVTALIGVNALLSGSEMAFVSLRERELAALEVSGRRGRRVAALARSPSRYLSALQLGITLAGFLASASAAVELSESVSGFLEFLGGSALGASIVIVTVLVSLATIVLGELVPKRIAMLHAVRWSLIAVVPLSWFMTAMRPVLALLEILTDAIVRITGNATEHAERHLSDAEFLHLIRTRAAFDPSQRQIITDAIELRERKLSQLLVPRPRVLSVDADDDVATALEQLSRSGFSRAPVVEHDLDHPIGQVNALDLVAAGPGNGTVRRAAHPILALPETLSALRALRRFQASGTKLAVVVDEHGGTAGIITFEDLIEELVGEVQDETDRHHADPQLDWSDAPGSRGSAGGIVLPGSFPVHRMDEFGTSLPEGGYATVAGLVLDRLGRLPSVGEQLEVEGWVITVTSTDRTSITAVTLHPTPESDGIGTGQPGSADHADQASSAGYITR